MNEIGTNSSANCLNPQPNEIKNNSNFPNNNKISNSYQQSNYAIDNTHTDFNKSYSTNDKGTDYSKNNTTISNNCNNNNDSSVLIENFDQLTNNNKMKLISNDEINKNNDHAKNDLNNIQSSEESNLIKDLIYLRNIIPNTLNGQDQSNNFDIENDINPEMVDKLFNSYSFDSFQPN